jgi:hypothetical protein
VKHFCNARNTIPYV